MVTSEMLSKNKINILSRHETKQNTAYIDDLIINEENILSISLVTIRAKEVLFRISELEQLHPLFFCQKTVILYFENSIGPSPRTSRCRNWVTSPLTASIFCCLIRGDCFLTEKKGCNCSTSPLYEPGVHLRFEIWTSTSFWYTLIIVTVYIWMNRYIY
jgi:hypothetical protein